MRQRVNTQHTIFTQQETNVLSMAESLWWGWAGGALSVVQLLPQIRLLCRTKSGTQISRAALSIRVAGYAMYLVHASKIGDPPLLWMTLAGLVLLSIIILQILYFDVYRKADTNDPN